MKSKTDKITNSNKNLSQFGVLVSLIFNVPFSEIAAEVNEKTQLQKQLYFRKGKKMPFYFDFSFGIAAYSKKGSLSFEFDKASSLK